MSEWRRLTYTAQSEVLARVGDDGEAIFEFTVRKRASPFPTLSTARVQDNHLTINDSINDLVDGEIDETLAVQARRELDDALVQLATPTPKAKEIASDLLERLGFLRNLVSKAQLSRVLDAVERVKPLLTQEQKARLARLRTAPLL